MASNLLSKRQEAEIVSLLKRNKGSLRPIHVVKAARRPSSALHRLIGWHLSDEELAHAHRIERARLAIQALRLRQATIDSCAVSDPSLKIELQRLVREDARATIRYDFDLNEAYRSVAIEVSSGRSGAIRKQIIRELKTFLSTRAVLDSLIHEILSGAIREIESRTKG